MSKFEELSNKVRHYYWLCEIAKDYDGMIRLIDNEKDYFTIEGFSYSARGDVREFNVNCHRTIPYKYIRDGLADKLAEIKAEIAECEKDLDGWL